jgi:hypothetical protein
LCQQLWHGRWVDDWMREFRHTRAGSTPPHPPCEWLRYCPPGAVQSAGGMQYV